MALVVGVFVVFAAASAKRPFIRTEKVYDE